MPAGIGQCVWVSDFKGFGLADCDPRLAKVFLDLSAAHYPERLGLFIVIDAPWYLPSARHTQLMKSPILHQCDVVGSNPGSFTLNRDQIILTTLSNHQLPSYLEGCLFD